MLSPWNRILNIFAANMHYLSKPPNLSALSKQIGVGTSFISTLQNNINVSSSFAADPESQGDR